MGDMVSIITPAYNSARFIADTIESVISQTYQDWEMIIVDDCSDDETVSIARKYGDDRIRCISHHSRMGAAAARNTALKAARGRWIAFLDSDDLWETDKLERQIRFMVDNDYAFSYTAYRETDVNGKPTGRIVKGPKHIGKWGMYAYCWPGCLTVMYDTHKVGLVQTANLDITDDYAIWLKVVRKAECHLLDAVLARHRGVPGSLSDRGYAYKVSCHYRLFRHTEGRSFPVAMLFTGGNLLFGTLKKLLYVKKE